MDHSSEFYLMDSTSRHVLLSSACELDLTPGDSFFAETLRIGPPDYLPTETDVLRARQKSTGITETRFALGLLSRVSTCPQQGRC